MPAAALPPSRAASAAAAATERRPPRVAVVGAGFAGLAAALTLQRSGRCEVTVLEASSRPGGRACTLPLEGHADVAALELGATWFHGLGTPDAPNPVYKHAQEQRLIGTNPTAEKWWSSQFLLPGAAEPLSKEQQIAVTHALAAWTEVVEGLPEDASGATAEHLQAAWERLAGSGKVHGEAAAAAAAKAWRWRELLQRAMDGCHSTADQSAQGLALYDEMPGGVHCALPAGMQTVAQGLAVQLSDLRYGHAVQRIAWATPAGGVRITCANGETLEADCAVVTVSLGVLKAQHGAIFEPALPPAKAAAIQRLRIGVVDKVLLDFERPALGGGKDGTAGSATGSGGAQFEEGAAAAGGEGGAATVRDGGAGSEPAVSYALLWSCPWQGGGGGDAALQEAVAPTQPAGAEAAASGQAGGLPATAAEEQVPEWAKGIFSLRFGGPEVKRRRPALGGAAAQAESGVAGGAAALEKAAGGETTEVEEEEEEEEFNPCAEAAQPSCYQAVAWVTGEAAQAMEAASDEEVLRTLRQVATIFPQIQLPPGASWDRVTLHRSSWGSDPLFRGSYSYLGPDCSPADIAALAAPVYATDTSDGDDGETSKGPGAPVPALLFAGEACHVMYIGTMHGAYLTGQQAAERLLEHWQREEAGQAALASGSS